MATERDLPDDHRSSPEPWPAASLGDSVDQADLVTSPGRSSSIPPRLSGYWGSLEILEPLGSGGFGHVYRARDPALAREVALKIIDVPSREPARIAEVLREGQLLARVRHPNVVTVYGAEERGGAVGIWMELVHGRTFNEIVSRDGPMGPEEACVVGIAVCRALAAVHGAGLVHRDIKAHNIIREDGGRVVLMDFGAGWDMADKGGHRAVLPTGTPLYMAPELLSGQAPSVASDIYSLGVLLFFLVTGEHPVQGRTITDVVLAHGLGQRRLLNDARPDLPSEFVRAVEHALAVSPDRRYATVGGMIQALIDAIPGTAPTGPELPGETTAPSFEPTSETPLATGAQTAPFAGAAQRATGGSRTLPYRAAWVAAGLVGGIWAVGLLASLAFNTTLGRVGRFSTESPFEWWIWGLRSFVAPVTYVAFALGVTGILRLTWSWVRSVPFAGRVADRLRGSALVAAGALKVDTPRAAGLVVILGQVISLGWFCSRYQDLITAWTSYVSTAEASRLAPLAPSNEAVHDDYRLLLPLIILGMILAWLGVWRWQRRRQSDSERPPFAVGVGLIVVAVVLLQAPYRILRHNEFQRVTFAGERCYAIGEAGSQLLLYCPDTNAPRNKVVDAGDPRLERSSKLESIFTPREPTSRGQ